MPPLPVLRRALTLFFVALAAALAATAQAQDTSPAVTPRPKRAETSLRDRDSVGDPEARNKADAVIVPQGTKIPLVLKQAIDTKNARVGDGVYAETTFPVALGNRILIPSGTFVQGTIASVKKAGMIAGRAEIMMHFTSLIFPSGYTVMLPGAVQNVPGTDAHMKGDEGKIQGKGPIGTDSIGTVASTAGTGAIIGAVSGGGKGALEGGLAGAAVGTVIGILSRDKQIHLPSGTSVEMVIQRDVPLDGDMLPRPAK